MKLMKFTVLLAATAFVFAPHPAAALNWKAQRPEKEKADLISFCRTLEAKDFPADFNPLDLASKLERCSGKLDWLAPAIHFATGLLRRCEGGDEYCTKRRSALRMLDYPLHVDNFADDFSAEDAEVFNAAAIGLARAARARVLKEVPAANIPEGRLKGWLVYNMGFVLKGGGKTVLIDISDRPASFPSRPSRTNRPANSWTAEEYRAFAEMADLLLVTHLHGDHTSYALIGSFLSAGKPVVLPSDPASRRGVADNSRLASLLKKDICHKLTADSTAPLEVAGIKIRNFSGHQGKSCPCNVYHLEIGGVVVVHNGDNYDRSKEAKLAECPAANVIIASSWNNLSSFVLNAGAAKGFDMNTAMLIPAHENEMHHEVLHRESYKELYGEPGRLAGRIRRPVAYPLFWGESFTFEPKPSGAK